MTLLFLTCPSMMILTFPWTMRCPSCCMVPMMSFLLCRCLLLYCDKLHATLSYLGLP